MKKGEKNSLKSQLLYNKSRGDLLIPILAIVISLIGILFIYSASNYSANLTYNDKFYYVKKQGVGLIIGVILMFLVSKIDYQKLKTLVYPLMIIAVILLALIFTPLGLEVYGARRWLKFFSITIQPSEIAKFSLILFTAYYFNKKVERTKTFKGILPVLLYGALLAVLIMLEPNMSITVCVVLLLLIMLYLSGVSIKFFIIMSVPLLLGAVLLIILEPYRLKRLTAFLNPWASPKGEGYQLLQSLYALGNGGLFGVGIFNSRQKYKFLPFAESDFILSVIGEEIGLVGILLLFLLMFILIIRGIKTASKCKDFFGYLLSVGITAIYAIQVSVNALVVTGSIPPTGLPVPLISAGNTSLIVFLVAFGVLYSISKQGEKL